MKMWKFRFWQCKSSAVSDSAGLCIRETKWEKLDNKHSVCTAIFIVVLVNEERKLQMNFFSPS